MGPRCCVRTRPRTSGSDSTGLTESKENRRSSLSQSSTPEKAPKSSQDSRQPSTSRRDHRGGAFRRNRQERHLPLHHLLRRQDEHTERFRGRERSLQSIYEQEYGSLVWRRLLQQKPTTTNTPSSLVTRTTTSTATELWNARFITLRSRCVTRRMPEEYGKAESASQGSCPRGLQEDVPHLRTDKYG